jgi:hypothetical protein
LRQDSVGQSCNKAHACNKVDEFHEECIETVGHVKLPGRNYIQSFRRQGTTVYHFKANFRYFKLFRRARRQRGVRGWASSADRDDPEVKLADHHADLSHLPHGAP